MVIGTAGRAAYSGRLPQRRPGATQLSEWTVMRRPLSGGIAGGADRGSSLHRYHWPGDCRRQKCSPAAGIGFWIWNGGTTSTSKSIIIAIVIIGVVGLLLEQGLMLLARRFSWQEK